MNTPTLPPVTYASKDCFCLKGFVPALRQFRTLLAKELRENCWLMLAGALLMAVEPLQYALWREPYSYSNGSRLGLLGVLYASLVGIAATVRDLSPARLDFWRSRAIGTTRFVSAKWLAGLFAAFLPALVMFAADAVLCVHRFRPNAEGDLVNQDLSYLMGNAISLFTFALAAYALAFCIGNFVRRGVDAAILTATALLILWLLPLVLPPLAWLNISTLPRYAPFAIQGLWSSYVEGTGMWQIPWTKWIVTYHPPYLRFAAGMLSIAGTCAFFSWLVIRRDWKIQLDRKLILWSLGGSVVLLVASMLWAVRSNLEPRQELQLFASPGVPCVVSQFIAAGEQTWAIGYDPASRDVNPDNKYAHYLWPLEHQGDHWSAGAALSLGALEPNGLSSQDHYRFFWSPLSPDLLYAIDVVARRSYDAKTRSWSEATYETYLRTFSISLQGKLIDAADLKPVIGHGPGAFISGATVAGGKLIVALVNGGALVFEPQPNAGPRLLAKRQTGRGNWGFALEYIDQPREMSGKNKPPCSLSYPAITDLLPEDRLAAGLALPTGWGYRGFLENRSLLCYHHRDLRTYNLTEIQDAYALFRPDASLEALSLEKVMHGTDPMVYGRQGRWYWHIDWGGGLTLYDIAPHLIRRAGHFNRPHDRFRTALALPDTLLVGGKRLYVIPLSGR